MFVINPHVGEVITKIIDDRNSDIVEATLLGDLTTDTTIDSGTDRREICNFEQISRIRRAGDISSARIARPNHNSDVNLLKIEIGVWRRKTSVAWDLISRSGDIKSQLVGTPGGIVTVNFPSTISGVLPGDYVTVSVETNSTTLVGFWDSKNSVQTEGSWTHTASGTPPSTNFNWRGATIVSRQEYVPVEILMQAPSIIFHGDSNTEGHPSMHSFVNNLGFVFNLDQQISYMVSDELGWVFDNTGTQGESSTQGLARFQRDVVDKKPKACVIAFGTNDILIHGIGKTEHLASIEGMLDLCVANDIIRIISTIPPTFSMNDTEAATRRDWNSSAMDFRSSHNAIVINNDLFMGKLRVSTGFFDDLRDTHHSGDNLHFSVVGKQELADLIIRVLKAA